MRYRQRPAILFFLFTFGLFACLMSSAGGQSVASMTQRRINDLAAAFLRVRIGLIEHVVLRRAGETPNAYFARIVEPLPSETSAQCSTRIAGYLRIGSDAAAGVAALQQPPTLLDTGSSNSGLWQRASRDARGMRTLTDQANALWRAEMAGEANKWRPLPEQRRRKALGDLLAQILYTSQDGYNALRDASP